MGQALDRDGNVLAEATGDTKREVFDQLQQMRPDADEIRIKTMRAEERLHGIERDYIDKPFAYHKPSDDGFTKINRLRAAFSAVQRAIDETCPNSRQKSIATTELETAAMWAIKAVVFNDPASVADTTR